MNIFSRFRKHPDERLKDKANELVPFARAIATSSFEAMLGRFAFLHDVDLEHYDFVMTTAFVFTASTRLQDLNLGSEREAALRRIVVDRLVLWTAHSLSAFDDCNAFYEREYDKFTAQGMRHGEACIAAIGLWIAWNVLEREPKSDDEFAYAFTAGAGVMTGAADWWTA